MEGVGDGNLNGQQLIPVGQLPGSAQDSGVEEGCDDHDSNESSSTTSRGGAEAAFHRHNSSDRDGAIAGEESNLSYGDPPSNPQLPAQDIQNEHRLNSSLENVKNPTSDGDEMDQEGLEGQTGLSLPGSSTSLRQQSNVLSLSPSQTATSNTFPAPILRNSSTEGPPSGHWQHPMPSTSAVNSNANILHGPPPSVTEDGYLGDCSSDGGNEKNFPIPDHRLKRFLGGSHKNCKCHPISEEIHSDGSVEGSTSFSSAIGGIEPPAGLAFQNIQPSDLFNSCGYHVLLNTGRKNSETNGTSNNSTASFHKSHHHYQGGSGGSRKMRSTLKSRLFQHSSSWSSLKANIAERKIRLAAGTNNSDQIERLLANGQNPNAADEHKRTALHIAAAKGYANSVASLLQGGADPNVKDLLGNTPLHLAACTNHIEVVTLLLRAGTNVATLDNNGRTPVQLAQSKLKLLQRSHITTCSGSDGQITGHPEMGKVKTEVGQVVEMMREYLSKTGHGANSAYNELLNSFSYRFSLHQTQDDLNSDLQSLLDSLGSLKLTHQTPSTVASVEPGNKILAQSTSVSESSSIPAAATATSPS